MEGPSEQQPEPKEQAPHEQPVEPSLSLTDGRVPRFAALVREALAVLAAILVAFALDAWWDSWRERTDMLEALDAVRVEIERNVNTIDSTFNYNRTRGELVRAAVAFSEDDVAALSGDDLDRFANLPDYLLATLELGAVTAFIEGGFLATLDDRDLRAELAGLPRLQDELDEEGGTAHGGVPEAGRSGFTHCDPQRPHDLQHQGGSKAGSPGSHILPHLPLRYRAAGHPRAPGHRQETHRRLPGRPTR